MLRLPRVEAAAAVEALVGPKQFVKGCMTDGDARQDGFRIAGPMGDGDCWSRDGRAVRTACEVGRRLSGAARVRSGLEAAGEVDDGSNCAAWRCCCRRRGPQRREVEVRRAVQCSPVQGSAVQC